MKRPNKRKLQAMINRTAITGCSFHRAQAELNEYCREIYGREPGEVDADSIIDAVMGGCGEPDGMNAAEFDEIMKKCIASTGAKHDGGADDRQ